MSNYVTPATLPNPFQNKLLDIVVEECAKVLRSLMNLRDASVNDDAKAVETASAQGASETGHLAFTIELACRDGLFGHRETNRAAKPLDGAVKDQDARMGVLDVACIRVAQRYSKAKRFGLSEVQKGQPHDNAQGIIAEGQSSRSRSVAS